MTISATSAGDAAPSAPQEPQGERTALYRMFGADGELLYLGISRNFGTRWQTHASRSVWWPDVRSQAIDWHESREAAAAAEIDAIRTERPKYNVAHNPDATPAPQRKRAPTPKLSASAAEPLPWPRLSPEAVLRDMKRQNPCPWFSECTHDADEGGFCNQELVEGLCPDHGALEYDYIVTEWSRSDLPIEELRAAGETVQWHSVHGILPRHPRVH